MPGRPKSAPSIHFIRRRPRADLPRPHKTFVTLVPKVGSVGKHRGAVAARPLCARNAGVTGRQELLTVT